MRYLGKITDPKDLTTKEYVDNNLPVYEGEKGEVLGFIEDNTIGAMELPLDDFAKKASPEFTGTPTAPTAAAGTSTTQIATTAFVSTAIENLPEPMVFKGTLGEGGTIISLPPARDTNEGYTYKVITAGTYSGTEAKVGDTFISNGSEWVLIPSGDEPSGTVTNIATGTGLTGGPITSTGTISLDTTYVATTSINGLMSAADKEKLDGIAEGATANVGTVTSVGIIMNGASMGTVTTEGTINLGTVITAHQDITGKEDKSNKVTTWSATVSNANYPSEKLVKDSLDGKANAVHGHAATEITGLAAVATSGSYSSLTGTPGVATTSANGFMSSTDKAKLDGIASGATAVSESTVSGWGFTKNTGTVTSVSGTGALTGSVTTTGSITHTNSGVTAGTYNGRVTVNAYGHVTGADNIVVLPTSAQSTVGAIWIG